MREWIDNSVPRCERLCLFLLGPAHFDALEPDVVIAASDFHGFGEMFGWELAIQETGDVRIATWSSTKENGYCQEWRFSRLATGVPRVQRLILRAEEIGFRDYPKNLTQHFSDLGMRHLAFRSGAAMKAVCDPGNNMRGPEGQGFLELWREIQALVPEPE